MKHIINDTESSMNSRTLIDSASISVTFYHLFDVTMEVQFVRSLNWNGDLDKLDWDLLEVLDWRFKPNPQLMNCTVFSMWQAYVLDIEGIEDAQVFDLICRLDMGKDLKKAYLHHPKTLRLCL